MQLLGAFLALAFSFSAVADALPGTTHAVPAFQWVETMNLRELDLTSRVPRCGMEAGTQVTVIDSNKVQSFVKYQAHNRPKRVACPDGAKFYLKTKELLTYNAQSKKIADERKALETQTEEILSGKSTLNELGNLRVNDHFQAHGANANNSWAEIQIAADNESTLFNPGDTCKMDALGRVRILGFLNDKQHVLFRYEAPRAETFKNHCPSDAILLLEIKIFVKLVD